MWKTPSLIIAFFATAFAMPVSIPKSWTPRERAVAAEVTENGIRAHVRMLADDLLEGRGPASRGSELAMKYVAAQFERLGLLPLGGSTAGEVARDKDMYLQRFALVGLNGQVIDRPVFRGPSGGPFTLPASD